MNKEQALHSFWSGFGVPAYDENTVPEDAALPRITYEVSVDSFGGQVSLSASIWDRSTSWISVTEVADAVTQALSFGGRSIPYEGGLLWLKKGTPFAQRMGDTDDSIRRIYLNVEAEFLSEV